MDLNLPTCCLDMEIKIIDLLFPERMSPEGLEFVKVHGLGAMTLAQIQESALGLGDGLVKLYHRCEQLDDAGLCKIYNTRPVLCRVFECSTRSDCACAGKGRRP